jgi:hypothetical protein
MKTNYNDASLKDWFKWKKDHDANMQDWMSRQPKFRNEIEQARFEADLRARQNAEAGRMRVQGMFDGAQGSPRMSGSTQKMLADAMAKANSVGQRGTPTRPGGGSYGRGRIAAPPTTIPVAGYGPNVPARPTPPPAPSPLPEPPAMPPSGINWKRNKKRNSGLVDLRAY